MYRSRPKNSGIYYIKDNIESLQFKIHFRSINTLLKLPRYNFHSNLSAEQRANATIPKENPQDDCTTIVLKWQQKLFSCTEAELYSDVKNCLTDQQRNYHQLLKQKEREVTASERKHTRKKRHRKLDKTGDEHTGKKESNYIFTYVNEDHFESSEDHGIPKSIENSLYQPCEKMFVYAALKPDTQLVVLKWFKQEKLLYIYPDFNEFQHQPYFIELDTDYRHLYSYGIEDNSLKLVPGKPEAEEFLYLPELSAHWRYEDDLAKKFAMPPKRTQRCAILFSINDVSDFEYDNVHVRYTIKLPADTILEEGLLESSTHTASAANASNICHIGLSWQLTVLCEEQFDPSQRLKIYFEIISIDSWERERFEGFCHYSLILLKPQHETVQLQCVRPVESFLESLNRYFIGGRRKFDYIRFVSPAAAADQGDEGEDSTSGFHCRYGIRMRNSGKLRLSCQMLTQRNCELLNPCASRTTGMTLDDIMMAYKEARRRLEAITVK